MRNGGTIIIHTLSAAAAPIQSPKLHPSPLPYLFGGLAAMLCLIALALLILACSYWKLSMFLCNGNNCERSIHSGDDKSTEEESVRGVYEGQIGVIMAGDVNPTYLAIPRSLDEKPKEDEEESGVIISLENPHQQQHQTQ
ncbi:hypothetical protein MKX01_023610 [Papaver californicum]|nr:hypothetical protein MKX01_023610 [Papaver californicum]